MNKLHKSYNHYNFTTKKTFVANPPFRIESIQKAFDFAYKMSFGGEGEHRDSRSGGTIHRKKGEIFSNTFQGKLAEFAIYNICHKNKVKIPLPDLETYDLGKWDTYDFKVNNKKISVKSTKYYGQLMLLETKDWDKNGRYVPNINTENCIYDYFILVRIKPSAEDIMKKLRILYSNECDYDELISEFLNVDWSYDIPGYINNNQLKYIISNNFIIPKGAILGKYTKMDAENYYIQTGDMTNINYLFKELV